MECVGGMCADLGEIKSSFCCVCVVCMCGLTKEGNDGLRIVSSSWCGYGFNVGIGEVDWV